MRTLHEVPAPKWFAPHPNLSDAINRRLAQSEIEGGVFLRDLQPGDALAIETQDWTCTLVYCGDNEALVSGHPEFCPEPVRVYVAGSTWGGSMLKQHFIGRGMCLELIHPRYERILTSMVTEIEERGRRSGPDGNPSGRDFAECERC